MKCGRDVLLVERAPMLRGGGYVVDFWGVGYGVAEKIGLLPPIRELGYQVKEVRFVDREGRTSGGFSTDVFGRMTHNRFTSVRRSDIAATICHALDGEGGDDLRRFCGEETGCGVHVGFNQAAPARQI